MVPEHNEEQVLLFIVETRKLTVRVVPIILTGVATWEDTVLAIEAGVQGVVLSNHGGRQLDMARSGLEILVEVVAELKKRKLWPNPNFHIFIDGGVRRASDILKALALGASAVGIGKGFLYSYCAYGQEGVERAIEILREELIMDMRMLGIAKLSELVPEMVDARGLPQHSVPSPEHVLYNNTCAYLFPLLLSGSRADREYRIQMRDFNLPSSGKRNCNPTHHFPTIHILPFPLSTASIAALLIDTGLFESLLRAHPTIQLLRQYLCSLESPIL